MKKENTSIVNNIENKTSSFTDNIHDLLENIETCHIADVRDKVQDIHDLIEQFNNKMNIKLEKLDKELSKNKLGL